MCQYLFPFQLQVLSEERVEVGQGRMLEEESMPNLGVVSCHVTQNKAHPENDILHTKIRLSQHKIYVRAG